jgi:hypothetical protein
VCYGSGSAGPLEIARAADGAYELIFLFSSRDQHSSAMLPVLASVGEVIDVAREGYALVAKQLRGGVAGVVTFCDPLVSLAAWLAAESGCPANSSRTTDALTDKRIQREMLNEFGVSPTRAVGVTLATYRDVARDVGLPAVVKRVRASASRVRIVASAAELEEELRASDSAMLLEELLIGVARASEPWLGDYVSVESVLAADRVTHLCVVDKLPLAADFLELGSLVPSTLPAEAAEPVFDLTTRALRALNMRVGIAHTEIKLTRSGPRIIEVNGRLGGFVGRLLNRASSVNPIRLALDAAVGATAELVPVPEFRSHAGTVHAVIPAAARRVMATASTSELRQFDGVVGVRTHLKPVAAIGEAYLPRVQTIDLEAPSREELVSRAFAVMARAYSRLSFE